jgi:hypothetical protein
LYLSALLSAVRTKCVLPWDSTTIRWRINCAQGLSAYIALNFWNPKEVQQCHNPCRRRKARTARPLRWGAKPGFGPASEFFVDPLQRVGSAQRLPLRGGEPGEGEEIVAGLLKTGADRGRLRSGPAAWRSRSRQEGPAHIREAERDEIAPQVRISSVKPRRNIGRRRLGESRKDEGLER